MQPCDRQRVEAFDYSKLSAQFAKLSKPAKRALINHQIFSTRELAARTLREVAALHGIGPSAMPILKKALREAGLDFRA